MKTQFKKRLVALIALATTGSIAAVILPAQDVSAVPSFARIHKLKCSECHIGFPVLNQFGWEFKQRGYRLPGEEGAYIWDHKIAPVSLVAELRYLNQHQEDAATGARVNGGKGVKNQFQFEEIELFAAGTIAPKIGYFIEFAQPIADGDPFAFAAGWVQFSDLLPNSMLNLRAGAMDNEFYYLSQARRLTMDTYISPVSFGVTGVELNGYAKGFRYAAGLVNDERDSTLTPAGVNLNDKLQGFYAWGTYEFMDQTIGIRFINSKANSSVAVDGRTFQQLDANAYLQVGPAYVILAYFHNWNVGGVDRQQRRSYLGEVLLELMQEQLFLDTRFEWQDTSPVSGGNNPTTANATHFVAGLRYFLKPNVAVIAEFDKTSGAGTVVQDVGGATQTEESRERYILGLHIGF